MVKPCPKFCIRIVKAGRLGHARCVGYHIRTKDYPYQFEIQYITSDIYDILNVFLVDREAVVIVE